MNNINDIIYNHKQWVESEGLQGIQMSLDKANMKLFPLENPVLELCIPFIGQMLS